MNVRPAQADDIPAMARVAQAAYASGFAEILETAVLVTRDAEFFASRFAEALPLLSVAERDGVIVGFSKVTGTHLDMLFVNPGAQGSGAGSALLGEAERRGTASLECFRDNHAARRFYERKGWRLTRAYEREFMGAVRAFVFYEKP